MRIETIETIPNLLPACAARGTVPAIIVDRDSDPEVWSYESVASLAWQFAGALRTLGVGFGEPVALLASNRAEWVVAYLGIVTSGALAVPIDHMIGDDELSRILRHCGAKHAVTTASHALRLRTHASKNPIALILLDGTAEDAPNWRDLPDAGSEGLPVVLPTQLASLLYTSGTTGLPKGVPLSHGNFVANLKGLLSVPLAAPGDRVLLPLPLHHAYAFTVGMLGTLASGATIVFPAGLSGPQIVHALHAVDVSTMVGVPGLYSAMLGAIERKVAATGPLARFTFRLALKASIMARQRWRLRVGRTAFRHLHREFGPRLRRLASGGARLEPDMAWALEGLGWEVLSGYGLTETAPILTFNRPGEARIGTEGAAVPGVELRVESAPGEQFGEILARGPSIFAGYWHDDEATRSAFTTTGWFRTGDLGFLDDEGYLHIIGRRNELVVLPGGQKFFPEAVETILTESPYIREVAVLTDAGSTVALAVPNDDAIRARGTARAEHLVREEVERLSVRLRPHERPTGLAVTRQTLPRTHLGKLRRHLLPALYGQARAGSTVEAVAELSEADRAVLAADPARRLWEWLRTRFPDRSLSLDASPQLDLGIDSLRWIALTLEMQDQLGIRLSENDLTRVINLRDLVRIAAEAATRSTERGAETGPALTADQRLWLERPSAAYRMLGVLLWAVNRFIMRFYFGLKVHCAQPIPPNVALIITPNHCSYLDPFVLAAALDLPTLRHTVWAGWTGKLFTGPVSRAFSRAAQVVPVDPDRGPAAGLALGREILRRRKILVWFPEGRRSPTGKLLRFLPGIGVLVKDTGAMVIPVRISGTFEALPLFRAVPRRHTISVAFGPPMSGLEIEAMGTGEDSYSRIADGLRKAVAGLPTDTGR